MSSTGASSPAAITYDDDSDASGTARSNYTLLYIIVAVLIGMILYMAIRYGRSVLAEYRQLQAGRGAGAARGSRTGLRADEIAALPRFTYRVRAASASPLGNGSKGRAAAARAVECVVCLQELDDGDVVRVLPACRHFFHGGCIDVWLRARASCPVCRAELEPERDRPVGGVEVSPPLPQLRRCGVSPERPSSASRVLADILARSPLRSPSPPPRAYTRVDDQWTKPPSPGLSEIRVVSAKTPSPRSIGVLERAEVITSPSSAPVVPEDVISRSKTPSPIRLNRQLSARSIALVGSMEAITLASPSQMPAGEGGGGSLSKSSSPEQIQYSVGVENRQEHGWRRS